MPWLRSIVAVLIASGLAAAADWPQWLGPDRDGVSSEKVAPWQEAPKTVWSRNLGEGHSSPVVAGGRVFIHAKVKDKEEEEVSAFDARTGKPLWHTSYPRAAFSSVFGNGPRATPAVAGGRVYTYGATGVLSCFKADSGEKVWQVDALKEFKAANLTFGVSSSPLVEGDKVLVEVGGKGAGVVAFDKNSGKVLWKALDDPASYSSPIALGAGAQRQVVFFTQQGLVSLAPGDGSVFWKYPLVDRLSESSVTPVRVGDLLLATSVTSGAVALRLDTKDGKPAAEKAWKNPDLNSYFSTPMPVGKDLIFLVTATMIPPSATLRCVESKTGNELWHRARVGKYHAALLRTGDGKLLMLDDSGNLVLIDPGPKEYRELARAKVCGQAWAHPALSDGRLFVRDDTGLICLQLGP